ncbi:MAG: cobalamin biosynthesis protein CbiG, partial [Pseudoflavonifractor sp.]
MKLALIAFTRRGLALAQGLRQALESGGDRCSLHVPPRLAGDENPPAYESLQRWTEEAFACEDGLIFVG